MIIQPSGRNSVPAAFGESKNMHSTEKTLPPAPEPVDHPPAYSDYEEPSQAVAGSVRVRRSRHTRHPGNREVQKEVPNATVDQVHIFDRRNDITGTFYIDPSVPLFDLKRAKKHGHGKGKSKEQAPHASFRTHNNAITLDLGTTGDVYKAPKANVAISNRHKDIRINILPLHASTPSIGLDIESRHGNIIIFVPEEFSGVIDMRARKGNMDVLPALAARAKMVKHSDNEILFMIGPQERAETTREASFCQLVTRTGNITVGLLGRDQYTPQAGFWQRLFRSGSSQTS